MTIKHLVISGGGPTLFKSIGAVQELQKSGTWKIEEIESIYGTSAGGILGTLLCLKFDDWDMINDYIIKRPWNDAFPININTIFDSFTRRGLFDRKVIEIFFKPLFAVKDISLNITLNEFYEYSKIELHLFTFEINQFKEEDISYLTHPNLNLLTAIQMTMALPIIVSPVCIDNKCYIDGGVVSNYPLNHCISHGKNINEILSFKNNYTNIEQYTINEESSLLDYIVSFLYRMLTHLSTEEKQEKVPNEVLYDATLMSLQYLNDVLTSQEVRRELVNSGINSAKKFLELINNNINNLNNDIIVSKQQFE